MSNYEIKKLQEEIKTLNERRANAPTEDDRKECSMELASLEAHLVEVKAQDEVEDLVLTQINNSYDTDPLRNVIKSANSFTLVEGKQAANLINVLNAFHAGKVAIEDVAEILNKHSGFVRKLLLGNYTEDDHIIIPSESGSGTTKISCKELVEKLLPTKAIIKAGEDHELETDLNKKSLLKDRALDNIKLIKNHLISYPNDKEMLDRLHRDTSQNPNFMKAIEALGIKIEHIFSHEHKPSKLTEVQDAAKDIARRALTSTNMQSTVTDFVQIPPTSNPKLKESTQVRGANYLQKLADERENSSGSSSRTPK